MEQSLVGGSTKRNQPARQDILLSILQSIATSEHSREEGWRIALWLNNGQLQDLVAKFTY